MDYTLDAARHLAEELRAIPPKDPSQRRLDKQAMVRELAQEIVALQQRGYTIEEVAESLRGRGFEITTPTLKNYLQRAKRAGAKPRKPRRTPGPPGGQTEVGASPASKPSPARAPTESGAKAMVTTAKAEAALQQAAEPSVRSGKSAFLIKDRQRKLLIERTENHVKHDLSGWWRQPIPRGQYHPTSFNRQNAFASFICAGVRQAMRKSSGLATTMARHCARDVATLSRLGLYRKGIPRGASTAVELAIE